MMKIREVSRRTGITIRTLQYYDTIGLLRPAEITEAGYRLYDETDLERLQQILLFRELQFPLKEIRRILDSPGFDRDRALQQQIELLTLKKEHIENVIELARKIQQQGVEPLTFEAFDTKKIDDYAERAKAEWGGTAAWREYEEKSKGRSREETAAVTEGMMAIFREFGAIRDSVPADSKQAQELVKKLQAFITEHFYTCTVEILRSLGAAYAAGGEMSQNIDQSAGEGTARYAGEAVQVYCSACGNQH